MSIETHIFPQAWEEHLTEEAPVSRQNTTLPTGAHTLGFKDMSFEQFEQFCWWLLRRDHDLVGCQRLGQMGAKSQQGIDLFAFERSRPDQLHVFECKCRRSFSGKELLSAVDTFLAGEWANRARKYTLILAQDGLQSLSDYWLEANRKLHGKGIEGDIWTAEHLTERLQDAPDVLLKFFPGADSQQFGNAWMAKVGFTEKLLKAITDPRPEIANLANDYLVHANLKSSELETHYFDEKHWSIKQPFIDLSSFLPAPDQYPGSAAVSIKLPSTGGVTVVLDQKWLLTHFLGNNGEPVSTKTRPFYRGTYGLGQFKHIVDLNNCQFHVSDQVLQEIVGVADRLSDTYLNSLRNLEAELKANNFPVVQRHGTQFVLCVVEKDVWDVLISFANAHDTDNGNTTWHIFHRAFNRIMPYSPSGYRAMLFGESVDELCDDHEIAILWNASSYHSSSDNVTWSCQECYRWLTQSLLPAAGHWHAKRSLKWRRACFSPIKTYLNFKETVSYYSGPEAFKTVQHTALLDNHRYREIGLVATVSILQAFFNSSWVSDRAYFDAGQLSALYGTLLILLPAQRGHPSYICAKLNLSANYPNHLELAQAVEALMVEVKPCTDTHLIDNVMRAMLETLDGDASWVSAADQERIFGALFPFMIFHDQKQLINRHSLYL